MADTAILRRNVVVIGASAGGVPVLLELAAQLPPSFDAIVLIVQHIGAHKSILPDLLGRRGPLPAVHAEHAQRLQPGVLCVAPPDCHMRVVGDRIRLTRDAKENHTRPAIDPLFRSAAIAKGPQVVGVLLSGRLDDGTAGLQAIKACGGLAVVQDPADADSPEMPASAIHNVAVDLTVRRRELGDTLARLVLQPVGEAPEAPANLVFENQLGLSEGNAMEQLDAIGRTSKIACPDCSGVLWKISDSRPPRYRCHTGHAFTQRTLEHTQAARADEALWRALRALREREALLREMAGESRLRQDEQEAARLESEADHVGAHAGQLARLTTD